MPVSGVKKQQELRFSVRYIAELKDIRKVLTIIGQSRIRLIKKDLMYVLGEDGNHGFLIVENNTKKTAGFLIYEKTKSGFHIHYLVVRPSMRRKGAGKEAILHIVRKTMFCGSFIVSANVSETNLCGQLFLKRQDFEATDTILKFYKNGDNSYFMQRCICDNADYEANTQVSQFTTSSW